MFRTAGYGHSFTPEEAKEMVTEALETAISWRDEAACLGTDPDLFFPVGEGDLESISAAKEVCAICPVKEDCLAYSLETNQTDGIWGGHTATERRRLRRRWLRELREAS